MVLLFSGQQKGFYSYSCITNNSQYIILNLIIGKKIVRVRFYLSVTRYSPFCFFIVRSDKKSLVKV